MSLQVIYLREGLRDEIGVELYYFDHDVITKTDFVECHNRIVAASEGCNDILVANFGVGLAHGNLS